MQLRPPSRDTAAALDESDPLRRFRDRFVIAEPDVIYLDGNSLGRLPRKTPPRLAEVMQQGWGGRLIRAWKEGWMELPLRIGDRLGSSLLGAAPGQVAIADSTTVCLYKLAAAALAARPGRTEIVTDHDNFPTDRYVLEGLAHQLGLTIRWIEADPASGPTPDDVAALTGPATALVSFTHVAYRSAFVLDLPAITRTAHDAGALVLWDLSHSAGALPLTLDADEVDLAVGCTYKYLNGGPGAPAFLYVADRHQGALRQPIWGWLGRREPFEMAAGYEPAPGVTALLSGTPPVLALSAVGTGVDLVIEADITAVDAKAIALGQFAIALADEWLAPLGSRSDRLGIRAAGALTSRSCIRRRANSAGA
jgi:kynureninase